MWRGWVNTYSLTVAFNSKILGQQGFTRIKKDLGLQGFTSVKKGLGLQGFTGVKKGLGLQGFTSVKKGLGLQGFTRVKKGLGLQGFTGVKKGLGLQGFTGIKKDLGMQGFTGVKKGLGLQGSAEKFIGWSRYSHEVWPNEVYFSTSSCLQFTLFFHWFGLVWFGFMVHQPLLFINAKSNLIQINSSISSNSVLYKYSFLFTHCWNFKISLISNNSV